MTWCLDTGVNFHFPFSFVYEGPGHQYKRRETILQLSGNISSHMGCPLWSALFCWLRNSSTDIFIVTDKADQPVPTTNVVLKI
jgi:hypothetical protein